MTKGTIDRASAVMVPVFLTYDSPQAADTWARDCAMGFTLITLFTEHIAFSPNPTRDQSISGLWGEFVSGLTAYTRSEDRPSPAAEARALAAAHIASRNPEAITRSVQAVKTDPSYQPWVLWHARYQLVEHSSRLNGLFDFQFLEQIGDAMNLSASDVKSLWDRSRRLDVVQSVCDRLIDGNLDLESEHIAEAWLISTLLRGVYHDELARIRRRQNYRHPARSFRADDSKETAARSVRYEPSATEKAFAATLLGIAVKADRSPSRRIKLYNQNAAAVRHAILSGSTGLGIRTDSRDNPVSNDQAVARAAREASWMIRDGIIDVGSSRVSTAIEISAGLTSTAVAFTLTPWAGLAVGVTSAISQALIRPGSRFTVSRRARPHGLERLARAVAGPVDVSGTGRR